MVVDSHYGWSHNTGAAIDLYSTDHAILQKLTCIEEADRIRADDRTERLTVINSEFGGLDSLAQTTTVLETTPQKDPVHVVREAFLAKLGEEPEPAAHFYWSDLLIKCGTDQNCFNAKQAELQEYLGTDPQHDFVLAGTVKDENNDPVKGVSVKLSGSQFATALTDAQGNFRFLGLPTSGTYTATASRKFYTFTIDSQSFQRPPRDVNVDFRARLNRHKIAGRITKADGSGASGVTVQLSESVSTTTDAGGNYSFPDLAAGENYTIVPFASTFVFFPSETTFVELAADSNASFAMRLTPELLKIQNSESALVLDATTFLSQPFSVFDFLGYGNDGVNRLMLFAKNLEGINDHSHFLVEAIDDENKTYPLEIEFMGDVPQQSWLKQLNVKLAPELSGKCVRLRLTSSEFTTNTARICLAEP